MPRAIGIRTAQNTSERLTGQIHIYDGEGKGKSQVALGVVLRSIGLGIHQFMESRVLLLRFLKGPGRTYDEDAAIEALQRGFPHLIDQVRTGRAEFFGPEAITKFDKQEAQRGWDIAKGAIASGLYSVVVLDEINPVLDLDLLPINDVIKSLKNKPDHLEIIATGRAAPPQLVEIADLHSEMKPQIHQTAADIGIEGIEIYTGDGKGKSTSALGKALQAIGRGISQDKSHRVMVVQWLKGGKGYTEDAAIAALRKSYPHLVD
ncbi:MAG: cob(I)yrinic acid a,c-diamide adenosyltransferase, partial [Cyanobacteria bacterium J06607_13]